MKNVILTLKIRRLESICVGMFVWVAKEKKKKKPTSFDLPYFSKCHCTRIMSFKVNDVYDKSRNIRCNNFKSYFQRFE